MEVTGQKAVYKDVTLDEYFESGIFQITMPKWAIQVALTMGPC
jgi:hypothetical protein